VTAEPKLRVLSLRACGVPELGHQRWPGLLGGWFVFVDQTAEDGPAFNPFRWGIGDRVVGLGWLEVERAVRASSVVVPRVRGQNSTQGAVHRRSASGRSPPSGP
jgi:hypothetical protein